MNSLMTLFAAVFMLATLTGQALAMRHCGPLENIREVLLRQYGEQQSHVGGSSPLDVNIPRNFYVLFTNKVTGSFTFVVVYGLGNREGYRVGWTCIRFTGYDWSYQPNEPIIPGVDG